MTTPILPRWHKGRICAPWWYVLGWWPLRVLVVLLVIRGITMEPLETTLLAALICGFVGALAYIVLTSLARYKKQKTDAEKLKSKIAAEGRDPEDAAQLTAAERWEIGKAQKFDRIFIYVDLVGVILATAAAVGVLYVFGPNWIPDEWRYYAIVGIFAGIVMGWIFDETIIDAIATCTWQDKTRKAFQHVGAAVVEAVKTSKFDELVQSYIAGGIPAKDAKEMAKEYILAHPEVLTGE